MAIKFSNLASTTLASGVSSTATSLSVTSASLFPTLGSGDYFYASIGIGSGSEVVKVTAVSGTTFTVVRGQDDTTAISHSSGVEVALRVTAASLNDLSAQADTESVSRDGDSMTGNLSFGDNNKAIFGAASNLQIFSDGSNSRISETGSGNLILRGSHLVLQDSDGYDYITAIDEGTGGTVRLFKDSSEKLKTTSAGIQVTGSVNADGLEVEAATPVIEIDSTTTTNLATLQFTTAGTVDSKITHQASSGDMVIESGRNSTWGGKIHLKTDTFQNAVFTRTASTFNENSADIDFRVESNNSTHALFVDAGNDRVGLFTNSPAAPLDIQFGDNSNILRGSYASGEDNFFLELDSKIVTGGVVGYQFHLKNNGTAYNNTLTLDRGNVGVGIEAASAKLQVNGDTEGDTYFTGGTANSRLLNVFTSTHGGAANAGHNFKIASGQGAFIFGNDTTANLLTVKSGGIDVTGDTDTSGLFRFGVNNSEIANNYVRFKPTGAAYIDHSTVGQVINFRLSASSSLDTTPLVVNSTGIDVTGTATMDGLVSAGTAFVNLTSRPAGVPATAGALWSAQTETGNYGIVSRASSTDSFTYIGNTGSAATLGTSYGSSGSYLPLHLQTSDKKRLSIASNGDISFYEDTGQTAKLTWSASNESLTFGTNLAITTNEIDVATGDLTLDVAGDIVLDADGGDIVLKDGGSQFGLLTNDNFTLKIQNHAQDTDIKLIGNDGGSLVDALTLDMSTGGTAYFADDVRLTDNHALRLGNDGDIVFYHDNSNGYLENGTGNLTLDVAGDIILDADGGDVRLSDAGTQFGKLSNSGTDLVIESLVSDRDMVFKGSDGGAAITALTLDMSNAGKALFNAGATFNHDVDIAADDRALRIGAGADLALFHDAVDSTVRTATGKLILSNTAQNQDIIFKGNDSGSTITALTLDMSAAGAATFNSNITSGGHLALSQTGDFANTGLTYHTNGWLYARGGDSGIILKNRASTIEMMRIKPTEVVINDDGIADLDFRVESDTNTHALFVNGENSRIGLSQSNPSYALHIGDGNQGERLHLEANGSGGLISATDVVNNPSYGFRLGHLTGTHHLETEVGGVFLYVGNTSGSIFNEVGAQHTDFRVESDSNTHMLFVDASADRVSVGDSATNGMLTVSGSTGTGNYNQLTLTSNTTANTTKLGGLTYLNYAGDNVSVYESLGTSSANLLYFGSADSTHRGPTAVYFMASTTPTATSGHVKTANYNTAGWVFNEDGGDLDFRVESDTNSHMLFVDAGNNRIGVNTGSPLEKLQINDGNIVIYNTGVSSSANATIGHISGRGRVGSTDPLASISFETDATYYHGVIDFQLANDYAVGALETRLKLHVDEAVFNEDSSNVDFRVESNNKSHMLFVDASADKVGINQAYPAAALDIVTTDTAGADALRLRQPSSSETYQLQLGVSAQTNNGLYLRNTGSTGQLQSWTAGEVVINDDSVDRDFRVESNGYTHAFFVDGGTNNLGMGTTTTWPLDGGGSGTASSGLELDMAYDGTMWAGSSYWAGGLKTGTCFWSDASGDHYKRSSRYATMHFHNSQAGSQRFYTADSGTNGNVISWKSQLELNRTDAVFNEDGLDRDFRVESNGNANMLFVDGGLSAVAMGRNTALRDTLTVTRSNTDDTFGTTDAAIEITNANNQVGHYSALNFRVAAGNYTESLATVTAKYSGWSGNTMGQLSFGTRAASTTDVTERIRLDSNGDIYFFDNGGTSFYYDASSGLTINEAGDDRDFRVESNSNTHMLFVDAGNNRVILGGSTQDSAGTLTFSSGSVIRHLHPPATAKDNLLFAISGVNNGFQTSIDSSNNITYKFHTGGNVQAVKFDTSESVFNEGSANRDFRVESDNNANMLFVDASADFVAFGNSVANPASGFASQGGAAYTNGGGFQLANSSSGASLVLGQNFATNGSIVDFRKQSTVVGSISVTGAATSYNTSSDARLKENIADADDAGVLIDAIQVRQFDWIADGEHQRYGMVAQELNTVAPEAVSEGETEEDMMAVDYSKLVPMLIKEIQTLRARVAQLESN